MIKNLNGNYGPNQIEIILEIQHDKGLNLSLYNEYNSRPVITLRFIKTFIDEYLENQESFPDLKRFNLEVIL